MSIVTRRRWGVETGRSPAAAPARTHVGNILAMLGARDRAPLVVLAHRAGLAG